MTFAPGLPAHLAEIAASVSLLVLDVDGVMTDGSLLFSASGDEIKAFNILDGLGIKQAMAAGIDIAVITGRSSPLTERRMNDLGIGTLLQGREDKLVALQEISREWQLSPDRIAYMGDDLPDLAAIRYAGLGVTVPNAHWFVRKHADYCTKASGGTGAVRELTDLLLSSRGSLDAELGRWLESAR